MSQEWCHHNVTVFDCQRFIFIRRCVITFIVLKLFLFSCFRRFNELFVLGFWIFKRIIKVIKITSLREILIVEIFYKVFIIKFLLLISSRKNLISSLRYLIKRRSLTSNNESFTSTSQFFFRFFMSRISVIITFLSDTNSVLIPVMSSCNCAVNLSDPMLFFEISIGLVFFSLGKLSVSFPAYFLIMILPFAARSVT